MEKPKMKKIIVSEFLSLDGVMEEPSWTMYYWNQEIADFKRAELFSVDSLLFGRISYEGFASAWPEKTDEDGYADRINNLPKFAVTQTLDKADWNNTTLIKENIVEEIKKLKDQQGQDILVFGSGKLVDFLLENQLVDEFNLIIYPLTLGKGQKLFEEGRKIKLNLLETKTFRSGAILVRYEVIKD